MISILTPAIGPTIRAASLLLRTSTRLAQYQPTATLTKRPISTLHPPRLRTATNPVAEQRQLWSATRPVWQRSAILSRPARDVLPAAAGHVLPAGRLWKLWSWVRAGIFWRHKRSQWRAGGDNGGLFGGVSGVLLSGLSVLGSRMDSAFACALDEDVSVEV